MICRYCGTALPDDALFCSECGRSVYVRESGPVTTAIPIVSPRAAAVASSGFSIADLAAAPLESAEARCPQCQAAVSPMDIFCGECGFVLRGLESIPPAATPTGWTPSAPAAAPSSGAGTSVPSSIVVLPNLIRLGAISSAAPDADSEPPPEGDSAATTEVEPIPFGALDSLPLDPPLTGNDAGNEDLDDDLADDIDDLVHEQPGSSPVAPAQVEEVDDFNEPLPFALPIAQPLPSLRSRPTPDPFPWGTDRRLPEDIEATRLVADTASGTRFVLQFSTGESVTVVGSGLVGRNPSMQPGEYVDQLVPIFDAGKSVSKTHLEYGQEAGRFWVSDRYSTNGTTLRQPDAEPRRADPGRRFFIARGTRVDIGEQFFVVS